MEKFDLEKNVTKNSSEIFLQQFISYQKQSATLCEILSGKRNFSRKDSFINIMSRTGSASFSRSRLKQLFLDIMGTHSFQVRDLPWNQKVSSKTQNDSKFPSAMLSIF